MPFAPSSFLLLVVRPGAPSSFLFLVAVTEENMKKVEDECDNPSILES